MMPSNKRYDWFAIALVTSLCFFILVASDTRVNLAPPEKEYKILMLLPFASQSHRNCFLPLAHSLADRGHKIFILSQLPPKSKHPNVKEINHGVEFPRDVDMFGVRGNDPTLGFAPLKSFLTRLAREMYNNPVVKELYDNRDQFDTFISDELFTEPAYPFLEGRYFLSIATAGIMAPSSAILGNVLNPSFIPGFLFDFPRPYSFSERVTNLYFHLYLPIYWRYSEMFPLLESELRENFPSLSPLGEIEKGLSLTLVNTHFSLDDAIPLLPSQVEVGGMHCQPGKKLPDDLEDFIDGSGSAGTIYFSLGSVCASKFIPEKYKKILLESFGKLKQKVIWKFEEEFKNLPKNIMIKDCLPQQDILAHPKIKLFITHGGLLSMQESIFHGKPLLALPIFGDQERNGQRILNKGFGNFLLWEELTTEKVVSAINELISNPKYINRVVNVSHSFRDQPQSPLEKAVWWTEYVIRHKGAPQLKSPAAELSWMEYLMIDVVITVHIALFSGYWLIKKILMKVLSMCFNRSVTSNKNKRKNE